MEKHRQSNELLRARIIDAINYVKKTKRTKFLSFLDPREQRISSELLKRESFDIYFSFFGGHNYCERKILAISSHEILQLKDWPISIFHLKPRYKGGKPISHSSVLGKLMNLGIHRDRIGDINITESIIQIFISKDLKDYINLNMNKISNISLDVFEVNWDQVIQHKPSFVEQQVIAASLRLDLIVSKVFGISRKDSSIKISNGHVKINWEEQTNTKILLKEKDVLSVRGKGRAMINEISSKTKKGNYKILIHKYK